MSRSPSPGSARTSFQPKSRSLKRKKQRRWRMLLLLFLGAALGAAVYLYPGFLPAHWGDDTVLVIDNKVLGEDLAVVEDREIYLHVSPLKEYLDPHFYWDEEEETAVITTRDRVIHMQSEELTAEVNMEPLELEFPLKEKNEGLFLPLVFLSDFYEIEVEHLSGTDTVVVDRLEEEGYRGKVTSSGARLREGPGIREATLEVMEEGDEVRVEEDEEGWTVVRSESGKVGYLQRDDYSITGPYHVEDREGGAFPGEREEEVTPDPPDHPINLVWEFAYLEVDPDGIGEMPPVNVVSPTWFHLKNEEGDIRNMADPEYVDWAHERGYQVWGLVTNDFDPELTEELLTSTDRRKRFIRQLLAHARLYDLDGLNIDFENFHYRLRDEFTQFVRELAPLCRKEGLVLSVDVSIISRSAYWSLGYDRGALAEAADYVALMAYDEHYAGSPVPGSVSSLPWVRESLEEVLAEVPEEKLLLGVPFYTYLWEIEYSGEDGDDIEKISSRALGMEQIEAHLSRRGVEPEWDEEAEQYRAEFEEDGKTYKVWLEEEESMRRRIELVNEYGLAGVAAWRRGFEREEIWEEIDEVLSGYPR